MPSTHLEDEQIQRLLHGELSRPAASFVHEHVAACPHCRERVAQAEHEEQAVHVLLRHFDHPPPLIDAQAVAARAAARGGGGVRWIRWAAAVLLTLGLASAAYAAPGSPVPAWVKTIVGWVARDSAQAPDSAAAAGEKAAAGIAVVPGRELVILFTSSQAEGQAQVSLTESAAVVVRAVTGTATFTSDADRLVIDNRAGPPAAFEIEIPRAARLVEIRVEGSRIFLKQGSRVTTAGSANPRGVFLLPLMASNP